MGDASSAGAQSSALPVVLKVNFTLTTPDQLRQINFGLEKDTDGTTVNWTIAFSLLERSAPSAAFGDPIVSLNVFVASKLHDRAAAAAENGLTASQTAHATGPAASAALAAQAGALSMAVANNIIQNTLSA